MGRAKWNILMKYQSGDLKDKTQFSRSEVEHNMKICCTETGCEGVTRNKFNQDSVTWKAFVRAVLNFH
jgi:hypothetical protein